MNANEAHISNSTGYFGPDSVTWQLYREPLALFGGVRALLLQVSHPSVADGVARFSNFKADPFGRGYRTFKAMAMIYFGSKTQAEQTAQRLWKIHSSIQGETPGTYSANDPGLLLWVLATLTDTTLKVYTRMPLAGLPPNWQERFYEESKVAARLLGIPEEIYPADLQAFNRYFDQMLEGEILGSQAICREVAQAIVQHPRAPEKLANLLATGWLPAALCERLCISAAPDAAVKLDRFLGRALWCYRLIPKVLRYSPAFHQAHFRLAKARGESPAMTGRVYHWLGKRMKIPLGLG